METTNKTLSIIYHFPCFDGAYGAINTYLYYTNFSKTKYTIKFVPMKNSISKLFAFEKTDKIVVLDVSLIEEDYKYLMEHQNIKVLLIDHHNTGIKDYKSLYESMLKKRTNPIKVVFDERDEQAACGLSFRYFKNKASHNFKSFIVEPVFNSNYEKIIKYVEDCDIGAHSLKNSLFFSSGMGKQFHPRNKVLDFSESNFYSRIKNLQNVNLKYTLKTGDTAYRQFASNAKKELLNNKIYVMQLTEDIKFLTVITEHKQYRNLASPFLGRVSKKNGYLPCGGCIYSFENGLYKVSLRTGTKNSVDVSEICSKFGGGGHIDAASFTMTMEEIKKHIVKEVDITTDINNSNLF